MRIDLSQLTSGQMSVEQYTKKVSGQQTSTSEMSDNSVHTTLTSGSTSVGALVSKAMNSPEIRQDLVNQLKESVGNGQYKLDPGAIAASMIDEHA